MPTFLLAKKLLANVFFLVSVLVSSMVAAVLYWPAKNWSERERKREEKIAAPAKLN